ncbi:hypothetical protein HA402_009521 [Bradysia odoriphaga]|nr:hypothetical protein HA402_009521 [Bradysia odoriphaga]
MSTICPRFAQNAWRKDLCSNCFKSKEEHKATNSDTKPLKLPSKQIDPPKGIMKTQSHKLSKGNVTFPKELTQVIGFGGEWSDDECSSDGENESPPTSPEDITKEIDELEQELLKLTKVNTDYNMSNLSNETDDTTVKRTFATLQLGTPVKDSDGKKQTLKISVMPFGGPVTTNKVNDIKQKFSNFDDAKPPVVLKTIIKTTGVEYVEEPAKIKSVSEQESKLTTPEKTLLEEISETLEKNKEKKDKESENKSKLEAKKGNSETKRSISRHAPIVKDQAKPKISVFPKFSDTDSNQSDNENGSGYYDVVEAATNYENLPNSYDVPDNIPTQTNEALNNEITLEIRNKNKSSFFSNHLISEMFSSSKDRKNNRGYNFMSKITTDGLIVAKASSDDAMDSTGSSFDYATSSDEEMSSMNRSESDSGIGICVTNSPNEFEKAVKINGNMDYEDIQVQKEPAKENLFSINKGRELPEKRREPDGSADPEPVDPDRKSLTFESEAPALPSSPPPISSEPRISFLHKTNVKEKPTVPIKPTVSIIKAFVKRTPNVAEQQVMTQLQQIMKPYPAIDSPLQETTETTATKIDSADTQKMKKTRAPNPPSPSDTRPNNGYENVKVTSERSENDPAKEIKVLETFPSAEEIVQDSALTSKTDDQYTYLYTRNPTGSIGKSSSPVIREKDKRERATINPKFRSLNTFSSNYKNHAEKARPTTPEPAPRKALSMSQDCLLDDKKKKNKFSIKKFLRMGSNKSSEPIYDKRESAYGKMILGDKDGMPGERSSKPRLVIIHPIDINQMEVEVVKEMGKVSEIVTGKPPPPLRKGLNAMNKPTRPPPPKSAEVRKKLKLEFSENSTQKPLVKEDSVYANLGEIRSAIAPRKPERTASMREREAQLELARKRLSSKHEFEEIDLSPSAQSTLEKASTKSDTCKVSSRLEIFERTISEQQKTKSTILNDGIKTSMQKMSSTIDSYLKDRMGESDECKSPIQTEEVNKSNRNSANNNRLSDVELRNSYEPIVLHSQRSSLPDNSSNYKITEVPVGRGGGYAKSDYGARYQNHSVANIARAVSRSYCGSEISETDIYSPYSFYGSEAGTDVAAADLHDGWNASQQSLNRSGNRLRMRKGRSVVHKNLEDNYGAVVVANHEALAQVLEQLQKTTTISLPLRPLANSINLRFEDFTILEGVRGVVAGRRHFIPAVWANQTHVTLALSIDCNQLADMNPVTEFCDLVPSHYLPIIPSLEIKMMQATISVLPRMLVDTLQSFGQILRIRSENLKSQSYGSTINLSESQPLLMRNGTSVQNLSTYETNDNEMESKVQIPGMPSFDDLLCKEVGFVMLQLVNGLKTIQAKGIEELPMSLSNVILCKDLENKDAQARLCVLHGLNQDLSREEEEPMGTLCQCAHYALTSILPATKLTSTLTKILLKDRSESLSRVKSVLEYALWGPSDVPLNGTNKERELALQRWLDLERATILHGLVRSRVELSAYDECHLMFLVRSSAKIMSEASAILTGSVEQDEF